MSEADGGRHSRGDERSLDGEPSLGDIGRGRLGRLVLLDGVPSVLGRPDQGREVGHGRCDVFPGQPLLRRAPEGLDRIVPHLPCRIGGPDRGQWSHGLGVVFVLRGAVRVAVLLARDRLRLGRATSLGRSRRGAGFLRLEGLERLWSSWPLSRRRRMRYRRGGLVPELTSVCNMPTESASVLRREMVL